MTNKERILSISKKLDLSHIGSNLSCLPVLEEIYAKKKREDIVILDNAHAHLAHLVVKFGLTDTTGELVGLEFIENLIHEHGIHCDRKAGCDASGGSLGHGLGIGIGYALADRTRDVYVVVSEGNMMEGSSWEALRLANDLKLINLHVYSNFNGYSAVATIDVKKLMKRMEGFHDYIKIYHFLTKNGEGYEGVAGHYKKVGE